jgi:hypothetical protein
MEVERRGSDRRAHRWLAVFFTTDGVGWDGFRTDRQAITRLEEFFTTDGTDDADCTDGRMGFARTAERARGTRLFTTDDTDFLDYTDGEDSV